MDWKNDIVMESRGEAAQQRTDLQQSYSPRIKTQATALKQKSYFWRSDSDSMTSFAIQQLLSDMQNAETLASSALRKSDDTGGSILGKV